MRSQDNPRGALADALVARGVAQRATGLNVARVAREAALLLVGMLALVASAHAIIPLPFTPVPITGQTFAVLLIGGVYGAWRGLGSVALYLVGGAAGLPFFAAVNGGATLGYLVGFALAATIVGWLAQRGWDRNIVTSVAAMLAGEVAIYACGLPWLARFVGWDKVIALGLTPFLVGDALKMLAAALVAPAVWFAVRRFLGEEPR